jgi:hypothetical protein
MSGDFVECHSNCSPPTVRADYRTDLTDNDFTVVMRAEHFNESVDVAAVSVHNGEVLNVSLEALHFVDKIGQRL